MKKLLLLSAAALSVLVMSADEQDLSPKNYQFYSTSANTIEELNILDNQYGAWNLPVWYWETNAKALWNDGFIAYGGAGSLEGCLSQISLVDFGGEVGKCLAICSADCDINDVLKAKYGDLAPTVKVPTTVNPAQSEYFFFFDGDPDHYAKKGDGKYMRIRLQANIYHNSPAPGKTINGNMYINTNANNVRPADDNITAGNALESTETSIQEEMEDENGDPTVGYVWDPTKWVTVEWFFDTQGEDEDGHTHGPKLKMNMSANWGGVSGSYCLFIRKIELTGLEGECPERAPHARTYDTLKPEPGLSGIASVVEESNAPAEYYNLQGVRVANPENGLFIVKKGNSVKKVLVK